LETLLRAEKLFEEPIYVHLYRHPFASVASIGRWAINREWVDRYVPTKKEKTKKPKKEKTMKKVKFQRKIKKMRDEKKGDQ
jgi:hypothetical protein